MNLENLAQAINPVAVAGPHDRDITAVCYDSRRATEGCLFVALPGEKANGTQFIDAAIDKGAAAIVSEEGGLASKATRLTVKNARQAMADLAAAFYRQPARALRIAGVTGTNG